LAVEPRCEVAGVGLDTRQPARKQRKTFECLGIGIRIGLVRADAFDAMVDGADACRQP